MSYNLLSKHFLTGLLIFISTTICYPQEETPVVIKNVNIVMMTLHNEVIPDATVVINNHRIASINGVVPQNAKVIEGKNKWLIPGLVDMHVHLAIDFSVSPKLPAQPPDIVFEVQDLMTPFIANGVTTIFNLNANTESFYQRKCIQNGNVTGPRMALAALIDGGKGNGRIANTPDEGRQTVRIIKSEGYDFIKLYSGLNTETYNAIVDEAAKQGLKTVGHIPNGFQNNLEKAFIPHFDLVAHAEEFSKSAKTFSYEEALNFAKIAKENGTWVTPTLTAMDWIAHQTRSLDKLMHLHTIRYVHPLLQSKWLTANSYYRNTSPERIAYFDKMVAFQFLLVRAFKESGVPMLTGTDAGVSGVVAGFSLHDELELLVQSGLTPEEALNAATRLAALWLGIESDIGTVEKGKLADLVLLDGNPLTDITNTRKIAGVFVDGQWLDQHRINAMLADLSRRNTASKEQFDWNKTMKK